MCGPRSYEAENRVERIVIIGTQAPPRAVTLTASGVTKELTFVFDPKNSVITIRKPDFLATGDFEIKLE